MNYDTICCISTAPGQGAISIIRVSGINAFKICNKIFKSYNKEILSEKNIKTVIIGKIENKNKLIDEVLLTGFKGPNSYTGEDIVEINCHGSTYIQNTIIQLLIEYGCRLAKKGEFTLRAFLNEKLDLSQAEAVAELISADNDKAHHLAMKQMRGGFSNEIKLLRKKFIKFASLIELELDFSQEDVEFADRKELLKLISEIKHKLNKLLKSFRFGNAIKNGIPISIVGHPNAGKSTLLNTILNEERAIVSDIKGTTRDTIEESIVVKGYKLRFIDTAGLRSTKNKIEKIGISNTYKKMLESAFILYMVDKNNFNTTKIESEIQQIQEKLDTNTSIIVLANKTDLKKQNIALNNIQNTTILNISAINGEGVDKLLDLIIKQVEDWKKLSDEIIIINQRHFESLINTLQSIDDVENAMKSNVSGEFLALDIKRCLEFLGEITGEITNENLLDSIFNDFCIGK
ncbi:MAG: tRNA uridine-5-carboxymethylaminomethyl(34) synthesis GTPase MnmE [Flavobacteriales bacterium]|mgnify:CR=1 FL=1|nr:tRNA uridine-5-carboxymethylaminomethyl(34) synthesis GTPase MnmE [Flavobacteriales bacterium]